MSPSPASAPPCSSFEMVSSFSADEIFQRYDGFLVDQWGVMHNGIEAMPFAADCIAELSRLGKKLIIHSNSPSGENETLNKLVDLGFDPSNFAGGAITSGTVACDYIQKEYGNHKAKVLCMAWKHPAAQPIDEFLKGCGDVQLVQSVQENPEVVIVQGCEIISGPILHESDNDSNQNSRRKETSLGDYVINGKTHGVIDDLLKECAQRKIPLICVDPDFTIVNPDKSVLYMPGTIAKRYEEFGGDCAYFGKPYRPTFEQCIQRMSKMFGITDKAKIAMIGDSLHHDIAGANAVGIDSIMVLGGVHRNDLGGCELGEMPSRENLQKLFEKENLQPTIVVPLLKKL